jgi:flagellar hook-associated protein 3 FlgL
MRVATSTIQQAALSGMLRQQAMLARTQNEVASGRRIQTPADDPTGAARIAEIERMLAENERYAANADAATNRLSYEERALADVSSALQRLQELALQANNGVVDENSRRMIGAEMRARAAEIVDIANRQDVNGEYLFAGFRSSTRPFERTPGGVEFRGDSANRLVQVGSSQFVADGHSGLEVFMEIAEGNGTFTTAAGPANTGAGVINPGSLLDPAAWVADEYEIVFTSPSTYEIRDSASAVVQTGAYQSDAEIAFRGISVRISGAPAAGDRFEVGAAGRLDLFSALDALIGTVESTTVTAPARARFGSEMAASISQIASSVDHLATVRADVGSRLSAIDSANGAREELEVESRAVLSGLRDVDYAEAITRMNQQLVALQAAQQSYTRIARLSLFDYL